MLLSNRTINPRDNILNDIETILVTVFEPSQSKGLVNRVVKREMWCVATDAFGELEEVGR
jgi:hypothetical protein